MYLFEFKNSIIAAKIKQSKSFSEIVSEVKKKFIHVNDRGKKKGVSQLLDTIEKVANGGFHFDDLRKKKIGRLKFFPIIIYTDDFLGINGIQYLFSAEFAKMKKLKKIERHKVFDVTLIHLQDMIGILGIVKAKKNSFRNIMETYFHRKSKIRIKKPSTVQDELKLYYGFRTIAKDMIRTEDAKQFTLDLILEKLTLPPDLN